MTVAAVLFEAPKQEPPTLSKRGFAEAIGVSQARVSQMIAAGLPTTPAGRIDVTAGKRWIADNVDNNRRRISLEGDDDTGGNPRAIRAKAEAELARLKADRLAGRLIDRAATLKAVEARARLERDAWMGWAARIAPDILAAGSDPVALTATLERLVRDQLAYLAATPLSDLK